MQYTIYERLAQYYETDQMGVIHHANYIRWLEEARTDFMAKIGHPYTAIEEAGVFFPVLAVDCEYKSPVHFGETVRIESAITFYNGIKMTASYHIVAEDGRLCTLAETRHCFLSKQGGPVRLQKMIPALHESFQKWTVAPEIWLDHVKE